MGNSIIRIVEYFVGGQDIVNLNIDSVYTGQKYEITCSLDIKVGQLKELIYEKSNIAPINQKLKYQDHFLANLRTLSYYRIENNSTVELHVIGTHTVQARCIIVPVDLEIDWVSTGEKFVVTCEHNDGIGLLKDLIQDETGIPPNNQKLKHYDETLSDHKKLSDYGIGDGSTVKLYEKNSNGEPRDDLSDRPISHPISYPCANDDIK